MKIEVYGSWRPIVGSESQWGQNWDPGEEGLAYDEMEVQD